MKKPQQLTQDQLNELKELAKTKMLKEIASHFNINKATFLLLRKEQPEIDSIYYKAQEQKKNKLYSAEEISVIEEMTKTSNMETIAKHLGLSMALLTKARKRQPELDVALIWGMKNRPSNFNHLRQVEEKAHKKEQAKTQKHIEKASHKKTEQLQTEKKESLFTRTPDDISQEEALERFRRLKEEDRARRQFQELKEIS
jgi:uncharacterized protein (UPF0147 family)